MLLTVMILQSSNEYFIYLAYLLFLHFHAQQEVWLCPIIHFTDMLFYSHQLLHFFIHFYSTTTNTNVRDQIWQYECTGTY